MFMVAGVFDTYDGRKRRRHKQYVDVLLRNTASGEAVPYAVCWVDGRTYFIDEILNVTQIPKVRYGTWTWAREYEIRLADHTTKLTMEYYEDNQARGELSYTRWYVNALDYKDCAKTRKQVKMARIDDYGLRGLCGDPNHMLKGNESQIRFERFTKAYKDFQELYNNNDLGAFYDWLFERDRRKMQSEHLQ